MAEEDTTGGVGVAEMMRLFLEDRKRREEEPKHLILTSLHLPTHQPVYVGASTVLDSTRVLLQVYNV